MILIDLCTVLLAPKNVLLHVVEALQSGGHEVAVYSALNRQTTREALHAAALHEAFDDLLHLDRMMRADFDFDSLRCVRWLEMSDLRTPSATLAKYGIAPPRVPVWLGWVGSSEDE